MMISCQWSNIGSENLKRDSVRHRAFGKPMLHLAFAPVPAHHSSFIIHHLRRRSSLNKKAPAPCGAEAFNEIPATTYSPTWCGSTIGAAGLNFSVRNGKRWNPRAIITGIKAMTVVTKGVSPGSFARARACPGRANRVSILVEKTV